MDENILFTGGNGFVGRNIIPILLKKGYKVDILDRTKDNKTSVICDLSEEVPKLQNYTVVIHAAGKAHTIPTNEAEEKIFFDLNLEGTKRLCKGLENNIIPKLFIFLSTVAVYGCEEGHAITEDFPLKGNTPYAISKIKAEEYLTAWCTENRVRLIILRPALLAGPDAPGNLGAMVKGINNGFYMSIAGGKAKKSMFFISDLAEVIDIGIKTDISGVFNLSDDENPSFREMEKVISEQLGKKLLPVNIPYIFAQIIAKVGDIIGKHSPINSVKLKKMTTDLTFSNEKVKSSFKWKPSQVIEKYKIF